MKRTLLFLPFVCGSVLAAPGGPQPVARDPSLTATLYLPWEKPTADIRPVRWAATNRSVTLAQRFAEPFKSVPAFGTDGTTSSWAPHRKTDGAAAAALEYVAARWRTNGDDSEQQIYVDKAFGNDSAKPFSVNDHILSITASHTRNGSFNPYHGFAVASGMLSTHWKHAQQYGYFEISARTPPGAAMLPYFRLLPMVPLTPGEVVEINVMEAPGNLPGQVTQGSRWARLSRSDWKSSVPTASTALHAYGALWTRDRIVFYVDRQAVAQIATHPNHQRPHYMALGLAVGGERVKKWLEPTDASLPASVQVDWIAAYDPPP